MTSTIAVTPSGQACGAQVTGVDLSGAVDEATLRAIRAAWLEHHVLVFPEQSLTDAQLERVSRLFGELGEDPFFEPVDGSEHVCAVMRRADETAPIFADVWHSDWSFMPEPPIATCLYGLVIPPVGGDTGFTNQQKALAEMPAELRQKLERKLGLHTAAMAYAPDGIYSDEEQERDRSMKIVLSETARDVHPHPLIITHPESGRQTLLGCVGYIMGIEGMADDEALELLLELHAWQTREEFQYTHKWQEGMLVLWDNRSVLHRAYGGYDGFNRELHRTTIAADRSKFLTPGQV